MDNNLKDQLVEFLQDNGVDRAAADEAARNCVLAVFAHAAIGSISLPLIVAVFTRQSALTLASAPLGALGGGVFGAVTSPSCQQVRDAVKNWSNNALSEL
jgi:hypothetical protein